jgi:Arc/MetJ-type ribon-helix-helix transcriptional regulator
MPNKTDLDHALQLRLPKTTVAEIDDVIATVPQFCEYNRCRFIRHAVRYALDSIVEETRPAKT